MKPILTVTLPAPKQDGVWSHVAQSLKYGEASNYLDGALVDELFVSSANHCGYESGWCELFRHFIDCLLWRKPGPKAILYTIEAYVAWPEQKEPNA